MGKKPEGGNGGCLTVLALLLMVSLLIYLINGFYPKKYSDAVEKYAEAYGLETSLVYAVIKAESGYNEKAVSKKGAKGLMQIMDKTGEWCFAELGKPEFAPEALFEPEVNIEVGCWYLGRLLEQFKSLDLALAAYNAGSGNVSSWLKNPDYYDGKRLHNIPFAETRFYVKKVRANMKVYEKIRGVLSKL